MQDDGGWDGCEAGEVGESRMFPSSTCRLRFLVYLRLVFIVYFSSQLALDGFVRIL